MYCTFVGEHFNFVKFTAMWKNVLLLEGIGAEDVVENIVGAVVDVLVLGATVGKAYSILIVSF